MTIILQKNRSLKWLFGYWDEGTESFTPLIYEVFSSAPKILRDEALAGVFFEILGRMGQGSVEEILVFFLCLNSATIKLSKLKNSKPICSLISILANIAMCPSQIGEECFSSSLSNFFNTLF